MALSGSEPGMAYVVFDGVKFKTFNKQEHDSDVPPRKIQRIVEDKNGYIWVKTIDRKLYVFNKVNECFMLVMMT